MEGDISGNSADVQLAGLPEGTYLCRIQGKAAVYNLLFIKSPD
ncbi:MAG: hypothetical protein R3B47_04535 [Bacteroidia bacterium]